MRPRLMLACVLLLIVGSTFCVAARERKRDGKGTAQAAGTGQSSDQIEIKADKFSGVVTATLKPQVLLDTENHRLTIEIETKLGEKKFYDFEKDEVEAKARFQSFYKGSVDFGDQELHFLIDGKPLNQGKLPGGDPEATDENMRKQQGYRIKTFFIAIFDRRALEQFGKANRIEMRLGKIELTFPEQAAMNLRNYANQVLAQQKLVKERK